MTPVNIHQHAEERAARARKYATWGLRLYGQVIPVDCDDGRPTWVTVVPLCPRCLTPVSDDSHVHVTTDATRRGLLVAGCWTCDIALGPLLPREEAHRGG